MLWFQAGASDFSRPGREWRPAGLPIVNRMSRCWFLATLVLSVVLAFSALAPCAWAQSKGRKGKPRTKTGPTSFPDEQSLTNIPLPIGHEAKGLVLPDFDAEGHLRGKFEAGTARRIDQEHVGFEQLKIYTYTPEDQTDLRIDMHTSVLDLQTRILSSQERTTVQRADFNIVGDSVQFDTNTRTGRLIGNVKMVITEQSHLTGKPTE